MEGKKFEQLDALRFFAVLLVVCSHWSWFGNKAFVQFNSGSRGVDLFFVISGFLITLGLIRSKDRVETVGISLSRFYIRRFLRIFPIYYLFLAVLWFFDHSKVADSIWWYVLYLGNFYCIKKQSWGETGYLWSLSVEEQFYLVWPFIMVFTSKKLLPVVMIMAILISAAIKIYWYVTGMTFWIWYMHPIGALDILSLGALLSYFYYFHKDKLQVILYNRYVVLAVFAILIIGQGSKYLPQPYDSVYYTSDRQFFGIFFAWLIGRCLYTIKGPFGYILDNKVLRYIGTISYSVYLFHPLVPELFWWLKGPVSDNVRFVIYSMATVALSSLSWYLFERQILKLKDTFQ